MTHHPLLRIENLIKHFPVTAGLMGRTVAQVKAVDGVSFEIESGATLGLVGESGCGKTTVGQTLLRLLEPTAGRVVFDGIDIDELSPKDLRNLRRDMQIVFQDPFNSLNPRMTVSDIVGEAMRVHGLATRNDVEEKVGEILERVGVPRAWMNRYPHEFSGGQRQRISIARAIALRPKLIVCDEAVSALDVSIQAQVINLLINLREELGLSYLFISHDLSVVKHISDRIAVMYLGQIVELAPSAELFESPAHPYTRALLSAIPMADPTRRTERIVLEGDVPTPLDPPPGCRFHTRCPAVMDRCKSEEPPSLEMPGDRIVSCFHAEGLSGKDWHDRLMQRSAEAEDQNRRGPTSAVRGPTSAVRDSTDHQSTSPSHARDGRETQEPAVARNSIPDERPWVRSRDWVAGALLLSGSTMLALGFYATGSLTLGMGLFGLARPLIASAGARWGMLAVALAAALLSARALERRALVQRAEEQLVALNEALDQVAEIRGRYPDSLLELGWRLPEITGELGAKDPWGRPWLYEVSGVSDQRPKLQSVGSDGRPGSRDDVSSIRNDANR